MNDRIRDYMMDRGYDRGYDRNYDRGYDRGDMYDRGYDRADMDNRGYDRTGTDGRNPYGSRGGYVTSRRPRGDRADMDYAYEYEGSFRGGDHDMDMDGRRGYRGRRDYGSGRKLERREIEEWHKKLMSKVPDSSKEMLSEDKIMKKVKEHGIKMEKFTEDEFLVTVIMMFTDYWETAGRGNLDMYVKLAEDFLCDEDAALKGGEKLAAYYDNIVMA